MTTDQYRKKNGKDYGIGPKIDNHTRVTETCQVVFFIESAYISVCSCWFAAHGSVVASLVHRLIKTFTAAGIILESETIKKGLLKIPLAYRNV